MGLETITSGAASTISDLNPDWPLSGDGINAGDDHIRAIKRSLQLTFENVSATVSGVAAELAFAHKGGTVSGNALIKGTLDVSATASFGEAVIAASTLHVSATASFGGLIIGAAGIQTQGNITASAVAVGKTLDVSASASFGGAISVSLTASFANAIDVADRADISGTLSVGGRAIFSDGLDVSATVSAARGVFNQLNVATTATAHVTSATFATSASEATNAAFAVSASAVNTIKITCAYCGSNGNTLNQFGEMSVTGTTYSSGTGTRYFGLIWTSATASIQLGKIVLNVMPYNGVSGVRYAVTQYQHATTQAQYHIHRFSGTGTTVYQVHHVSLMHDVS